MSGTTMIVMIVFVSVGFGVIADMYNKHLRIKEKTLKHNQASDAQSEELKQQVSELTERVQILEKINHLTCLFNLAIEEPHRDWAVYFPRLQQSSPT